MHCPAIVYRFFFSFFVFPPPLLPLFLFACRPEEPQFPRHGCCRRLAVEEESIIEERRVLVLRVVVYDVCEITDPESGFCSMDMVAYQKGR